MKFFDYIFIRSCEKSYEKTMYKNPFDAESLIMTLIGFNLASISYIVYTYYFSYNSSILLIAYFLIGSFVAAYGIAYLMYSYKSRYKKVIRKYYKKEFPKYYYYGMWTYKILTYVLCAAALGFNIVYEKDHLKKDPVYARAVITDITRNLRTQDFITYNYIVNNEVHTCTHTFNRANNRHIRVGDTCGIIYSRSKPGISELLKVNNREIIIVNRRGTYKPNMVKDSAFMRIKKPLSNNSERNLK